MDRLDDMFKAQRKFQERLGHDFGKMSTEEKIEYVKGNILALEDELHEALQEVKWKWWAKGAAFFHRREYFHELSDALHFLLNLYIVAGGTADTFASGYFAKNKVNHLRQDKGYKGDGKCPACQRALDEPA